MITKELTLVQKQDNYIDHHDKDKQKAWKARHSRILKDGQVAYKNKASGEYWNWHLTW